MCEFLIDLNNDYWITAKITNRAKASKRYTTKVFIPFCPLPSALCLLALPDIAKHFATNILTTGFAVSHYTTGGGNYRNTDTA